MTSHFQKYHSPYILKLGLLLLTLCLSNALHAQFGLIRLMNRPKGGIEIHPHYLCVESGVFNRAVTGISYYNNEELLPNHSFVSTFISVGNRGFKIEEGSNFYSTVGMAYNRGSYNNYFTAGLDLKYVRLYYWEDLDWSVSTGNFAGGTYGGFLGYTRFNGAFMLQCRISYMRSFNDLQDDEPWYNLGRQKLSALGFGISLGWNLRFNKGL
ncbi:hypothetical protein SAMN05216474_0462 [Lishizhenia tianjinensis]|uniref:Uncharacterized protein n=1 Tax=Lishizhenia tianjinensis TaxID=477690 RepID=A0A1I6XVG4_9FLAO|nr:hypothetical protein [Lishizhenia tianjinensis]SFT42033.1 hypothetical protein SAMN05216474_0462 [Lishizhenia tianjinensis]